MADGPKGGAGKASAAEVADKALAGLDIAPAAEGLDLDLLFDTLGAQVAQSAPGPLAAALDTVGPALQGPLAIALDSLSDDPDLAAAKAQVIADES